MLLPAGDAFAEEVSPEVDEGISSVKQENSDFSAEARYFTTPEFLLRYKNVSADWIHEDGA